MYNLNEGDEVITSAVNFPTTVNPIIQNGLKPVFVDADSRTYNIDANLIESAITEKTKGIVLAHTLGNPFEINKIKQLCEKHNLFLMEDMCDAFGSKYDGNYVGSFGDVSTLSFYPAHHITTGEGGMLVSSNPDIIARAKTMRLHGINRDVFNRFTDLKASWRYDVVDPGYKYNMTDMAAALGVVQLTKADSYALARRRLAEIYSEGLADLPVILPHHPEANESHCWHLYVLRLTDDAPINRDTLITKLQDSGIGCSVHYIPLHKMTYWSDRYDLKNQNFPIANQIFESCISLPLFPTMSKNEQSYVINQLRNFLKV